MPSDRERPSSSISRRAALRIIGSAAAFPLIPPVLPRDPWAPAAVHASWQPRFLDPKDVETVARLSECVLPRTDRPGRRDRAAHEYIDLALSRAEPRVQNAFSDGLSWLESYVFSSRQRKFNELDRSEQRRLLAEISDTSRSSDPRGHAFLTQIKQLTIEGSWQ
ncbi:MAG: gluconate 2-dehydrogenase subunit 3 family protein [Acidobacteria bacterium]|nr:MAG: gluconate 2-dehydrogenase subunit 3 family protein [Acidobacteriota bacterium]